MSANESFTPRPSHLFVLGKHDWTQEDVEQARTQTRTAFDTVETVPQDKTYGALSGWIRANTSPGAKTTLYVDYLGTVEQAVKRAGVLPLSEEQCQRLAYLLELVAKVVALLAEHTGRVPVLLCAQYSRPLAAYFAGPDARIIAPLKEENGPHDEQE